MSNYNEIPNPKPNSYKEWIVQGTELIRGIKGTTNYNDPSPMTMSDLTNVKSLFSINKFSHNGDIKRSYSEEYGEVFKTIVNHKLDTTNLLCEVFQTGRGITKVETKVYSDKTCNNQKYSIIAGKELQILSIDNDVCYFRYLDDNGYAKKSDINILPDESISYAVKIIDNNNIEVTILKLIDIKVVLSANYYNGSSLPDTINTDDIQTTENRQFLSATEKGYIENGTYQVYTDGTFPETGWGVDLRGIEALDDLE